MIITNLEKRIAVEKPIEFGAHYGVKYGHGLKVDESIKPVDEIYYGLAWDGQYGFRFYLYRLVGLGVLEIYKNTEQDPPDIVWVLKESGGRAVRMSLKELKNRKRKEYFPLLDEPMEIEALTREEVERVVKELEQKNRLYVSVDEFNENTFKVDGKNYSDTNNWIPLQGDEKLGAEKSRHWRTGWLFGPNAYYGSHELSFAGNGVDLRCGDNYDWEDDACDECKDWDSEHCATCPC